ncbi:hypothetical protein [Nocardioides sp. SYSU DS0663]|uniref:hypothetical protein n=1 Tax=Nocardioides sp. SYSU DS0663 TaxID=3416445 RepID=UPI003F4BA7A4
MPARPSPSRRTALALGVLAGTAAVTACDVRGALPGSPSGGSEAAAPADADQSVVAAAGAEVLATWQLVAATRRRHPRLRPALGDLERLHAAHAGALEATAPPTEAAEDVPARVPAALARVRRRERQHQRRLADLAVDAEAGRLAQLLGSMSAGVAQHLEATR